MLFRQDDLPKLHTTLTMKRILIAYILLSFVSVVSSAQGPNNTGTYYKTANGKSGKTLKTALWNIVKAPNVVSYNNLISAYQQTDLRADGKIWDMYSDNTNYSLSDNTGGYSKEGDMYNREHSFPKSWFGGKVSPMYSDIVHVVPADGYVNNQRGNLPFGENNGEVYKSHNAFSKVGRCTSEGYSGTCFEPNDEYKGDFARIYFYMVTCYEDRVANWSSEMLTVPADTYKPFSTWAMNLLLKWAKQDPVSQKEIDRNNAVEKVQGNRNPFVDYPGLEQYVWGSKAAVPFDYTASDKPVNPDTTEVKPDDTTHVEPILPEGTLTFVQVSSSAELEVGNGYLIVSELADGSYVAMADYDNKFRLSVPVSVSGNSITTEVNGSGKPRMMLLGDTPKPYTFYDSVDKTYLSLGEDGNKLYSTETATQADAQWTITFQGKTALITNCKYTNRSIKYNASSPRFATYKSGQRDVSLFKCIQDLQGVSAATSTANKHLDDAWYTLSGQRVATPTRGIYIHKGRKQLIVR